MANSQNELTVATTVSWIPEWPIDDWLGEAGFFKPFERSPP